MSEIDRPPYRSTGTKLLLSRRSYVREIQPYINYIYKNNEYFNYSMNFDDDDYVESEEIIHNLEWQELLSFMYLPDFKMH